MDKLGIFYDRVIAFNDSAGVTSPKSVTEAFWEKVKLQTDLLVEETDETHCAAKEEDKVELLDGTIDVLVIAFKLADFLEKAGYDVGGAFSAVCDNNDSKIYKDYWKVVADKEKLEERDQCAYSVHESSYNGVDCFTIRREDGKIMKPVDFKPVELSEFIPKEQ